MRVEIRFLTQSDTGRDKRWIDVERECRDLEEARRYALACLERSSPEDRAKVKRLSFIVAVENPTGYVGAGSYLEVGNAAEE